MGGGGGKTTVEQAQGPPQLIPQGAGGYQQAQDYYKGILAQPPVFGGNRVAPQAPLQTQAFGGASMLGNDPYQQAAREQGQLTASGGYLGGPLTQAAVSSASQPIFQQFSNQIVPGIRDLYGGAGQGIHSSREGIATDQAVETLGRSLGSSVVAPIFQSERQNMLAATGLAPQFNTSDVTNIATQAGLGGQQRSMGQEQIAAEQARFEEPIFRQSGAAEALASMAGSGPGSSQTTSKEFPGAKGTTNSVIGGIGALAPLLLLALA